MTSRSNPRRLLGRALRTFPAALRGAPRGVADRQLRRTHRIAYPGHCTICGATGRFAASSDAQFAAREFPCPSCSAALRFRNEAAVIVDEFGRGRHLSLATMMAAPPFSGAAIYNTGVAGPVRASLRTMTNYVESTYWDNAEPGEVRNGVQHQDLQRLTFADARFDLVTSSHVMEHVADPQRAFAEIHRVLRPGGRLIFSIPMMWPPPQTSMVRAKLVDGEVEHVKPAVFHESPGGAPSLVFTDFGTDLLDLLEKLGFHARQQRPHMGLELAFRDSVFVGIKR